MMQMLPGLVLLVILLAGCGYAAVRGGAPERWGAGLFFVTAVLSNVAMALSRRQYLQTEIGLMTVDVALMAGLIILALRAQRYWPMWAAAAQVDAVLTHILMFSHTTLPFSYAFALWLWALPIPTLIAIGAWRHRKRVKLWGDDPAWA